MYGEAEGISIPLSIIVTSFALTTINGPPSSTWHMRDTGTPKRSKTKVIYIDAIFPVSYYVLAKKMVFGKKVIFNFLYSLCWPFEIWNTPNLVREKKERQPALEWPTAWSGAAGPLEASKPLPVNSRWFSLIPFKRSRGRQQGFKEIKTLKLRHAVSFHQALWSNLQSPVFGLIFHVSKNDKE